MTNISSLETLGPDSTTAMGDIPAVDKMPTSLIMSPKHNDVVQAGTDFDVVVSVRNIQAGNFTNAQRTYYTVPQFLNGQGNVVGHVHITCEDLGGSFNPTAALDAQQFAFFKGVRDAQDANGLLRATVTGGLTAGFYRCCTLTSAANHQLVVQPVANRGSTEDCTRFKVVGDVAKPAAQSTGVKPAAQSTGVKPAAQSAGVGNVATNNGGSNNGGGNKGVNTGGEDEDSKGGNTGANNNGNAGGNNGNAGGAGAGNGASAKPSAVGGRPTKPTVGPSITRGPFNNSTAIRNVATESSAITNTTLPSAAAEEVSITSAALQPSATGGDVSSSSEALESSVEGTSAAAAAPSSPTVSGKAASSPAASRTGKCLQETGQGYR